MSVERVRKYLKLWNKDSNILEMEESTATVEMAAKALGTTKERIAKTISLQQEKDLAMVIVIAGDSKIDNTKFKKEFGYKPKMLSKEEALKYTGYTVGGICPFALPKEVNVYLDVSLKRFNTVFPACGSSNSAVEMTITELEQCSKLNKWVDVSKIYEE